MRLIDADELKKDDEVTMWLSNDAIRTGKQLKMFSELFIKKIDKQPTIQAVPLSVLQEIWQEITSRMPKVTDNDFEDGMKHFGEEVLYIIDKHIKEFKE